MINYSQDLPPYFVEVLNIIYLDHYVAGIGPLSNDKIITLGYQPPENNLGKDYTGLPAS